jgi:hypothetical protein
VAEAEQTWRIPDGMDFEEASVFPVAYLSSHVALRWQGRLEPGETLLVLGAAGSVGLSAVEIGKALGARVIAAASGQTLTDGTLARLPRCRTHGTAGRDPIQYLLFRFCSGSNSPLEVGHRRARPSVAPSLTRRPLDCVDPDSGVNCFTVFGLK